MLEIKKSGRLVYCGVKFDFGMGAGWRVPSRTRCQSIFQISLPRYKKLYCMYRICVDIRDACHLQYRVLTISRILFLSGNCFSTWLLFTLGGRVPSCSGFIHILEVLLQVPWFDFFDILSFCASLLL